jgi:uncharacterized protein YdeI (BOF family)
LEGEHETKVVSSWRISFLVLIIFFFLAACGSSSSSSPTTPEQPGQPGQPEQPGQPGGGPTVVWTTVAEILANPDNFADKEVVLVGVAIRQSGSDSDELVFTDGTGEIVMDFPSSNIPPLNLRIAVKGTLASSEIDVNAWIPAAGA